ncbi:4-coumarate-CoA ligase [Macrophomina phaseolina]|uniref:4-coumarate-CoA ligase n=1 Tax=Macrophomina phaseolina TaxID=35725 RepID=A0ABQ8GBR7_9PEZI|nr:4-coumarate-CoA ligase [Macrophomina phaseolina]
MIHCTNEILDYPRDATLTDILLNYNFNNTPPQKPAIIDGASGEVPGEVVGIISTTKNYFPVAVHGVLAVGGVVSAFNPMYQPKPKHIFIEDELLPTFLSGLSFATGLPAPPTIHVWSDNPCPSLPPTCHHLAITAIISSATSPAFIPHKPAPSSLARTPAFISFSSGTSGLVKGVALTHANIVANIFQQAAALRGMFTASTVLVLAVPFFHILGLAGFCCQYAAQGAPIVVFRRFEAPALLDAVERHKITHVNVVPPMALALLGAREQEQRAGRQRDLSSLRCLVNAAAPLKLSVADRLAGAFGCVVTQWYGMTEASPSLASQREDEVAGAARGSVGRLLPGVEARVVGEEGEDCGKGVAGEVLIRGPNLMLGYVKGEGLDGGRDADGWFRTGDVGYFDEVGYLFLVDRAKEMIKVKGNQVAPAELEAVLLGHTSVADAAVCGIHVDEEATEYPIAYVALHPVDSHRSVKDLVDIRRDIRQYVDGQVAHYKRLKGGVHILDAIPRNPSGKVLRRLLPANLQKAADVNRALISRL